MVEYEDDAKPGKKVSKNEGKVKVKDTYFLPRLKQLIRRLAETTMRVTADC
jgi:hypothetical protein